MILFCCRAAEAVREVPVGHWLEAAAEVVEGREQNGLFSLGRNLCWVVRVARVADLPQVARAAAAHLRALRAEFAAMIGGIAANAPAPPAHNNR